MKTLAPNSRRVLIFCFIVFLIANRSFALNLSVSNEITKEILQDNENFNCLGTPIANRNYNNCLSNAIGVL